MAALHAGGGRQATAAGLSSSASPDRRSLRLPCASPFQPASSAAITGAFTRALSIDPSGICCAGRRRRRSRSRRVRENARAPGRWSGGESGQRGGAIGGRQILHRLHAEIHAGPAIWAATRSKKGLASILSSAASSTLPVAAKAPSSSTGLPRMAMHPVVDRRIAGAGVEGQHRVAADISDIGDAADIHQHQRRRQSATCAPARHDRAAPAARPARPPSHRRCGNH